MPGMDGITAATEIKKKLKIPILLLTSACDSATVKRASAGGIAAFLTKPLRQQDLLPAIEIALQHSEGKLEKGRGRESRFPGILRQIE